LSVCSGIEAASVAWQPLGWEAVAFSEIEPFPCAVFQHHYPSVPNLGDLTKYKEWPDDLKFDLLVGGTPCQSYSVAGQRQGLNDPRGQLMFSFLGVAGRYRPRWVVWENVPGVLSSGGGRDFGAFLGALGNLGYGWAYRVLDAQWFGVPQRRRRVFVVGCLGDQRRAAQVLFERESLRRDSPPSREAGERTAPATQERAGGCFQNTGQGWWNDDPVAQSLRDASAGGASHANLIADTVTARKGRNGGMSNDDADAGHLVAYGGNRTAGPIDVATAVNAHGGPHGRQDFESETFVAYAPEMSATLAARSSRGGGQTNSPGHNADQQIVVTHSLRGEGHDASEDGTGRGVPHAPAVAIGFSGRDNGQDAAEGVAPTLRSCHDAKYDRSSGWSGAVAFEQRYFTRDNKTGGKPSDTAVIKADACKCGDSAPCVAFHQNQRAEVAVLTAMQVRRLTPRECERLQGFPDDYTLIPYRGKPAADGPRYKALGNSMAVPVITWLGRRIQVVSAS